MIYEEKILRKIFMKILIFMQVNWYILTQLHKIIVLFIPFHKMSDNKLKLNSIN